jgi:hypothetical protein
VGDRRGPLTRTRPVKCHVPGAFDPSIEAARLEREHEAVRPLWEAESLVVPRSDPSLVPGGGKVWRSQPSRIRI